MIRSPSSLWENCVILRRSRAASWASASYGALMYGNAQLAQPVDHVGHELVRHPRGGLQDRILELLQDRILELELERPVHDLL